MFKCPRCKTPVEVPLQLPSLLAFCESEESQEETSNTRRAPVWIANAAVVAVVLGVICYMAVGRGTDAASLGREDQVEPRDMGDPDPPAPRDMHNLTDEASELEADR